MKNHKCDRQIGKILSSFILGFGLQALFTIPALAETTDPETTANSQNSEDRVNEWYQLPAATNNLPDNFEGTSDRKSVENAQNLAEMTDTETTANSPNSEDRVNEWYQLPAATNNLPDNFEGTPDRKSVENAQNLAETTDPETTANSANSENQVNEWYQLPAATNNLPDNFEDTSDRKSVENAQNVEQNLPINPTSEQLLPIASEIETNTSNASETQPAEIPPLVEENKLENPPLTDPADNSMEQVTSVSQLGDVQQTDWAFQALQSLVERYGCIAGYPDETYRGNRAITRYEFAAGVNACLDTIRESIAKSTESLAKRDDLIKLQKLQEEFAAEIATMRGRVDVLEARTSELEANQFSTTTTLSGFTIFGIQGRTANRADRVPRDGKRDTKDPGTNVNAINLIPIHYEAALNIASRI